MTIGERIKERRIELGLSQEELAKKCFYKSRSSINKIELSRDLPLQKVTLMAKALECTESYLMGWSDIEGNDLSSVPEYDPQIQEVTDLFCKLNQEQKQTVLNMLRSFVG